MPEEAVSGAVKAIRVLLVDDEETQMELAKLSLEDADTSLKVTTISRPADALKLLSEQAFDCIVSDYIMPEMNGIQFCAEIRKTNSIPFIIYTGHGSEEVASAAFAAGANDYVRKEKELSHYKVLEKRIRHAVEKKRAEEELKSSEEKYYSLYTSMVEGVALHKIVKNDSGESIDYIITDVNPSFEQITDLKKADVVGKLATEVYGTEHAPNLEIYAKVAATGKPETFETYFSPMNRHFNISVFSSGEDKFATVFQDITSRKKTEKEMKRLSSILRTLSDGNRALAKAINEFSYLDEVCKIIIRDTDYRMVWVGLAEDDKAKSVRPVAYAGFDMGYINQMRVTWADDERGRGPTGTAIRTGQVTFCRDMLNDQRFEPWRSDALKRGYASSIVFPLMNAVRSYGAVSIYSREVNPWSTEEVDLLHQLADDISLGILSIREREARREAEEELRAKNKELAAIEEDLKIANLREQEYAIKLENMVEERSTKLNESETRLTAFMESTEDGFGLFDSELRLLDLNKVALKLFLMGLPMGTTKEDLIGKKYEEIFPGIEKTERYEAMMKVLRTGEPAHWEGASWVSPNIWHSNTVFLIGSNVGIISRNISRQRELQKDLQRAEVIAAVEQMGATVAHDLRGPLAQVVQAVNMAKRDPSLMQRMLQIVEENATRSLKMIADWRSSTREILPHPIKTDLSSLVNSILKGSTIPGNVTVGDFIRERP